MAKRPELLNREQIEELIERAFGLFEVFCDDSYEDPDDPESRRKQSEGIGAAMEAMRFAAAAIEYLHDPALTSSLIDVVKSFDGLDLRGESHSRVLSMAITGMVRAGARPRELDALATHKNAAFREAVAAGLNTESEEGRELLERLSADPVSDVRRAAREKLAKVGEVPWWRGKFSRDPAEGLSADEAREIKGTLEELAKLLDTRLRGESMARAAELLDELSDAMAIDGAERIARTLDWSDGGEQPVLEVMLNREGGSDAFLRVLRESLGEDRVSSWLQYHHTNLTPLLRRLREERQIELAQKLLEFVLLAPRAEPYNHFSVWVPVARVCRQAWPPSYDLTRVLDALLAAAEGTNSSGNRASALHEVAGVFARDDISLDTVADRILTARVEGYPGNWAFYKVKLDPVIERMEPERVRSFAERSLSSENLGTLTWAVQSLLGPLHDPERDPPLPTLAARFYEDPRFRRVFWSEYKLRTYAVPMMRRDLREGTIDFEGAAGVMARIDNLWGGGHPEHSTTALFPLERPESPEKFSLRMQQRREEMLAEHEEFLGPDEMRGPITDLEWTQWRRIRDRAIADGTVKWRLAFEVVPPGAAGPEDRPMLDRAIALWSEGNLNDPLAIAGALARQPIPSDLAVLDRMVRDVPKVRDMLKTARQHARVKLGLPAIPPRPEGDAKKPSSAEATDEAWPDEEDE